MLASVAVVVASGAVLVASSGRSHVPTGGVASAAAAPSASPGPVADPTSPTPAAERDRYVDELQAALAVDRPVAECLADATRATLGDEAFVQAHRAVAEGDPSIGHAVLDPAVDAARASCGAPAAAAPADPAAPAGPADDGSAADPAPSEG
jgi:hypothetical protein